MRAVMAGAALIVLAVSALLWSQSRAGPDHVSGIIETDEIRVGSRVGGRVSSVLVTEGQHVGRDETLVMLEPFDLQERLAEAQAGLLARRARLDKLRSGFRPAEIEQARARRDRFSAVLDEAVAGKRPLEIQILEDNVAIARAQLSQAESDYARVKKLHDGAQAAEDEMMEATTQLDQQKARFAQASDELALAKEGTRAEQIAEARAALAEAQQALILLEAGYRSEEIEEAAAEVAAAEAAVGTVRRQLDELNVTAPMECIVEAIDLHPGDLIAANAPVVSLIDPGSLWVRAYVPENRLDLSLGDEISIRVDSLPQRRFAGHVTYVSRQAEFTPSNAQTPEERSKQVFRVKVAVDEGLDVLRAGMSADVFLEPET